ncbi:hypothetical protein J4573_08155 [Actinomadura barringtoniae]|uniref:Uncharacterized protein n=1 Tax=Actinomadura barringtoniae TaxID=1427535 RepID=A0A939PCD2_9ACTN|nr:hypothetical protein [Actinomadura barringtoniae]MBO2447059.1 hypothetical protein [Actinomadura barringtoniae]
MTGIGESVHEHASRRRRLLILLAGFFGVAVTTTVSVTPPSGAAEVIRAGTAAAANTVSTSPSARSRRIHTTADKAWKSFCGAQSMHWGHGSCGQSTTIPEHVGLVAALPAPRPPASSEAAPHTAVLASALRVRGPPLTTGS